MRNISVYVIRIFVLVFLLLPQMADAKSDRLKPLWIKKAPESFRRSQTAEKGMFVAYEKKKQQ